VRNQDTNHSTVYLANALQPENGEIEIVRQTRDLTQSELLIQFAVHPVNPSPILVPPEAKHPWLPIAVLLILTFALIPALRTRMNRPVSP